MKSKILFGKPVSDKIKKQIITDVRKLSLKNIVPKLAAILIGNDPASKIYINNKRRTFIQMGCKSNIYHLENNAKEEDVIILIEKLNKNNDVHGILVQLPVPKHINPSNLIKSISYKKDVDGLHAMNMGFLMQGNPNFIPCTPFGCLKILDHYGIETNSKNVVIIGRSNLVGKPLQVLLSQKLSNGNATVTLCHSKTINLRDYTLKADIIIVAVGHPNILTDDMVKNNVVIIDVGINRINDNSSKGYYITGDVDYNNLLPKVKAITPVPGGVGIMTVTMLLYNTVKSANRIN